ncbi:glycine-rich domain-containing protein [Corynebacterium ulcerans]|uniref:glycine-rich domain-containing protein n=1 Tax=Corynebacterium ulcerans TaxID=65058 RepID=UPI0018D65E3B|nr:hypothetical protein [Corynebacterium ulcerans]MBH5296957.1 hypothetical protein [Corynebacterium ulcerans]
MIFVGGKAIKSIAVGAVQIQEVSRGGVVVWRSFHEPESHDFSAPGDFTITPPKWATKVQWVLIGAGGGGCGGDGASRRTGDGGGAGAVRTGVHQLKKGKNIFLTVGAGGRGGTGSPRGGVTGGDSSLSLPDGPMGSLRHIAAIGGVPLRGIPARRVKLGKRLALMVSTSPVAATPHQTRQAQPQATVVAVAPAEFLADTKPASLGRMAMRG